MRSVRLATLALLAITAAPFQTSTGQAIMIAPNAIVIDARTKTGAVTLVNTGDRSAEISLTTLFGVPTTDSAGRMYLQTFESVDDSIPSAANWVRAFPAKLVVAPGERRTVRLLVTPPASLRDGEYWARLVVASRAAPAVRDDARSDSTGVSVGLTLEVRSVLGLFYRHGAVATGVALDSARAWVDGDSVVARVRMVRRGNAAFVGSLRAVARDASGAIRASTLLPLGVYYTLEPRIAIARTALPRGPYTIELEATSTRPDVAAGVLLPIAATRLTIPIMVAESTALSARQ